jgi:hypothetical protein
MNRSQLCRIAGFLEDAYVKLTPVLLSLLILAATSALPAQSPSTPAAPKPTTQTPSTPAAKPAAQTPSTPAVKPAPKLTAAQMAQQAVAAKKTSKKYKKAEVHLKPFSSIAFGGGMSLMGVNMQAATNLNRYMNLRGTGNYFNYTASNISTNGFDLTGKVNMATAGASLDLFPFPSHGFRVSPGVLFYNQNGISATATPQPGTSFTLTDNGIDYDYYPDAATQATNPFKVTADLGLNTHKQAFTLTTGWGNVIPRKHQDQVSSHLTFPFELGVAFTGAPTINQFQLQGWACDSNGANCVDMAQDPTAKARLAAQKTKWQNDLNPYTVYPIFSFGVSYSFNLRPPE